MDQPNNQSINQSTRQSNKINQSINWSTGTWRRIAFSARLDSKLVALGETAKELILEIDRWISEHTGESRATEFLRQRISTEIERDTGISVLNTDEESRP